MLLPYRAKNPPEHFPCITLGLIAVQVLVFVATCKLMPSTLSGLPGRPVMVLLPYIRESVVQEYALSFSTFSPARAFTALFLHADLLHLAANLLALWLFGASVEGRLRPVKFLLLYLTAALAGDLAHLFTFGLVATEQFALGASGAIMGLIGAYFYMFPYATICVKWILFSLHTGVMEWQARWVALLYVGLDVLGVFVLRGSDGVSHVAHLGGFLCGLLVCLLLRPHRDSEAVSEVQAVHAETQDYALLSWHDLDTLMQRPTQDVNLILIYLEKAACTYTASYARCLSVLEQHATLLFMQARPQRLAQVLLSIPVRAGGISLVYYLRLASRLETVGSHDLASQLYRRVYDLNPTGPDSATALYRLGQLMQTVFQDQDYAQRCYRELLRLFPEGEMAMLARRALIALPNDRDASSC